MAQSATSNGDWCINNEWGKIMRQERLNAAYGKVFDVPGVINGSAKVRFMGVWPSGNVAVKRASDRDDFGPLTVSPETAKPLIAAIERLYPAWPD